MSQTTVAAVTINVAYKLKDMFTCLPVEKIQTYGPKRDL